MTPAQKRRVPVLILPSVGNVDPSNCQVTATPEYDHYMYTNTVLAIVHAVNIGSAWATVVDIEGKERYWEIQSSEWIVALEKVLPYFEKIEDWESCVLIRDLKIALTYAQ